MKRILCYGDSNTWGYVPNIDGYSKNANIQQYNEKDCWWYGLKQNNELFVDGLCGRCVAHENKWLKGRNAQTTIVEDLRKYNNLDLVIVQLGTNDCKSNYNDSPQAITKNLQKLLKNIKDITNAQIAIISPSIIHEDNKVTQRYYVGAEDKSKKLGSLYRSLAQNNNYIFVSSIDLEIGEDGEHLTKRGHQQLSQKVLNAIKPIIVDEPFTHKL